jgi:hypothetical protein
MVPAFACSWRHRIFYLLSSAANRQMAGLAIEWFYPRGYIMLPALAN